MNEARKALVFEAPRTGYSISQIADYDAITVGDLKRILEDFEDDMLFVLSHDRGYTFGSISEEDAMLFEETEDENGDVEFVEKDW